MCLIAQVIDPIFECLGLDGHYYCRFSATGILYGNQRADDNKAGLAVNIQPDDLALGAGIGLMLFYVVALQNVARVLQHLPQLKVKQVVPK